MLSLDTRDAPYRPDLMNQCLCGNRPAGRAPRIHPSTECTHLCPDSWAMVKASPRPVSSLTVQLRYLLHIPLMGANPTGCRDQKIIEQCCCDKIEKEGVLHKHLYPCPSEEVCFSSPRGESEWETLGQAYKGSLQGLWRGSALHLENDSWLCVAFMLHL